MIFQISGGQFSGWPLPTSPPDGASALEELRQYSSVVE